MCLHLFRKVPTVLCRGFRTRATRAFASRSVELSLELENAVSSRQQSGALELDLGSLPRHLQKEIIYVVVVARNTSVIAFKRDPSDMNDIKRERKKPGKKI